MRSELFGTLPDGTPVHRWTLERGGVRVGILTYGGIVQSVLAPDREGGVAEVALGFPGLDGYLEHPGPFLGALVGRYANRIAGASVTLDGVTHRLPANEGRNTLHGGDDAFDKKVWDAAAEGGQGVRLSRVSPDGEAGFPGTLRVSVLHTLEETPDGVALRLRYEAETDAPTVVSLTNHSYWNLAGATSGHAGGHELRLDASSITPADAEQIPTGGLDPVDGTRFDFRQPRKTESGYDHNFVLDKGLTAEAVEVGELHDPGSGRVMRVATTEPGLQLYTGDHLDCPPFGPCDGVALETQHYPDSPHHPHFPSTVLRPGERYASETAYVFSAR